MSVWLLLVVMSLATYRGTRLVVKDDFPPVLWARDRVAGGWRPLTPGEWKTVWAPGKTPFPVQEIDGETCRYIVRWSWVPQWLADLVSCPWCASGWLSLAVTALTASTVGVPAPVLVWGAVWAVSSLLASREWA